MNSDKYPIEYSRIIFDETIAGFAAAGDVCSEARGAIEELAKVVSLETAKMISKASGFWFESGIRSGDYIVLSVPRARRRRACPVEPYPLGQGRGIVWVGKRSWRE